MCTADARADLLPFHWGAADSWSNTQWLRDINQSCGGQLDLQDPKGVVCVKPAVFVAQKADGAS